MTILADHSLEGHALLIWGVLAHEGWLDLLPVRLVILRDTGLPISSNDRVVWRFAQAQQMVLLTGNRRMRGTDSLEQTIREENTATSLPVLTIGSVDRLDERVYREQCASRIVEIMLDIENYRGAGRIFIPFCMRKAVPARPNLSVQVTPLARPASWARFSMLVTCECLYYLWNLPAVPLKPSVGRRPQPVHTHAQPQL